MANILEKYGIKEVCDVTFYEIGSDGTPKYPVLYLDTLKVSTMEQTGEESELRGGKGNAPLIVWDYNKDITITLEDALFSARSMAIMFGDGPNAARAYTSNVIKSAEGSDSDGTEVIYNDANGTWKADKGAKLLMKTIQGTLKLASNNLPEKLPTSWKTPDGKTVSMINPKYFLTNGEVFNSTTVMTSKAKNGDPFFCTFDIAIDGTVIEISANSFPGTYYVTGDTYARSQTTGKDEFFQLIIPKAKVQSENTITMEAEGDPSVFNMSLRVLRGDTGELMKLVKYNLHEIYEDSKTDATVLSDIVHNHALTGTNTAAG